MTATDLAKPQTDHTADASAAAGASAELDLRGRLRELFGHDDFRPGQEPVVRAVMEGQSVLALMPTGAGKSLCYQLPAMLLPGTTLVISPLIALMKDQLDGLPEDAYNRTTLVNSTLSPDELDRRLADIAAGKYKLVYAAPERLRQWPFIHALRRAGLGLLVIDEAHCVDLWGHDFRPDYLFVGEAAARLGRVRVLAMTATATADLAGLLSERFGQPFTLLSTGVVRPNLRLEVRQHPNDEAKLHDLVRLLRGERGAAIVYVNSRDRTEEIARLLRREGIQASPYHAGLEPSVRTEVQDAFMQDKTRVVVATVAFGMGVDKANVRLIVHMGPPRSIEAYAQESGRAGRDGRPARCVLFYATSDRTRLGRWMKEDHLTVDSLRAVYKAVRDAVGAPPAAGRVSFASAGGASGAADRALGDETTFRVALSVLEGAGLLRRHFDLPGRFGLELVRDRETPAEGRALVDRFGLAPGVRQWVDPFAAAALLGLPAEDVEGKLLDWQADGWLRVRPADRQLLVDLPAPPADTPRRMASLLQRAEQEEEARLDQMIKYAKVKVCRQRFIAAHFGQRADDCGVCDNCLPDEADEEASAAAANPDGKPAGGADPATSIHDLLRGLPFRVGKSGLVKILTGSIRSPIKADRCPQFGALADCKAGQIEKWVDRLLADGFLDWEDQGEYRALALTGRWRDETPSLERPLPPLPREPRARAERPSARLGAPPVGAAPRRQASLDGVEAPVAREVDPDLFERLRGWRTAQARKENLPPYIIFHDRTLAEIARYRPTSLESLANVPGVGPAKITRYGDDVLALVTAE